MSTATCFFQECPTCGRSLRVRVEYLGEQVVCQHCGAQFQAYEAHGASSSLTDVGSDVLRRANELLDSVQLPRRPGQEAT